MNNTKFSEVIMNSCLRLIFQNMKKTTLTWVYVFQVKKINREDIFLHSHHLIIKFTSKLVVRKYLINSERKINSTLLNYILSYFYIIIKLCKENN